MAKRGITRQKPESKGTHMFSGVDASFLGHRTGEGTRRK